MSPSNMPFTQCTHPTPWQFLLLTLHVCMLSLISHVQLSVTPWTVAHQAPLSMGFSRQEHWSGLMFSPPEDLPDPGIKPASLMSPALAGGFFTSSATWEVISLLCPPWRLAFFLVLINYVGKITDLSDCFLRGSYVSEFSFSPQFP